MDPLTAQRIVEGVDKRFPVLIALFRANCSDADAFSAIGRECRRMIHAWDRVEARWLRESDRLAARSDEDGRKWARTWALRAACRRLHWSIVLSRNST
jgi:hypothetical protein